MLKGYKKRFVLINLSLIGAVLLILFAAISVYYYQNLYRELESTLSQVLEPFDSLELPDSDFAPASAAEEPPAAPDGERPAPPDGEAHELPKEGRSRRADSDGKRITTVFYNAQTDHFTVLPENAEIDEETAIRVAAAAMEQEADFGRFSQEKVIYYKQQSGSRYRLALVNSAYISSSMTELILILLAVFLLAMAVFFCISARLSRLAVKPLEESVNMEKQFITDISHDLKTPITVILTNNSILKESPDSTVREQAQWMKSTDEAAKNMLSMINEMLTLSSMESKDYRVPRERVNFSSAVTKAALQMESLAYDNRVELQTEIGENIWICANPEHLGRIASDLMENALKYEPEGGKISVRLYTVKKKAVLRVKNFQSHIDPEDLPHIFERFYRSDKARDTRKGHGLGLSIVQRMVELSRGTIRAESGEADGTVFEVAFDLAE